MNEAEQSPPPYRFAVRAALVLFAVVVAGGGIAYLAIVPPAESTFYPKCQLYTLTGLHCPGCGTTRAVHAVLNGRVLQSLAYNALPWVALPVVGIVLLLRRRHPRESADRNVWPWVIGITLVLFGILRNLPWHPFTLLAPHDI